MRKTAFKKFERISRPHPFKFSKGCLPQNLLSPLLNTLSHMFFEKWKLQAITINVKYKEIFVYDDFFFEKVINYYREVRLYTNMTFTWFIFVFQLIISYLFHIWMSQLFIDDENVFSFHFKAAYRVRLTCLKN